MCDSEGFDSGLVLEQNGNPVPNRVDPLALVALQAFLAAQNERLAADGADQDFEQVRRDHDEVIVSQRTAVSFPLLAMLNLTDRVRQEIKRTSSRGGAAPSASS